MILSVSQKGKTSFMNLSNTAKFLSHESESLVTVELLAQRFSDILCRMISQADLDKARELNKSQSDSMVCHTADFAESKEAMYLAFESFGIDPMDEHTGLMSDHHVNLWNGAWSLARSQGFRPSTATLH